jgi:hypothetical protein
VFSKNWVDKKVNIYSIPKTIGTHSATLESSYNINGLATGADISPNESEIYLTGYINSEAPFMYTIHSIPNNSLDIFSGTTSEKIRNIVPLGNQVEAIALFEITSTKHRLYISNEKFVFSSGPVTIPFPAKLWLIEIDADTVTLVNQEVTSDLSLYMYPNPFDEILKLSKRVDEIIIFDLSGRLVAKKQFVEELSLEYLNKGLYIAHLKIDNSNRIIKITKK